MIDLLVLLEMAKRFGEQAKPNCWECREQWAKWRQGRGRGLKKRLEKEVKRMEEE